VSNWNPKKWNFPYRKPIIHRSPHSSSLPRFHSHNRQIDVSNIHEALGYLVAHAEKNEKAELHLSPAAIRELKKERKEEEEQREAELKAEEEEGAEETPMEAGEGLIEKEEEEQEEELSTESDSVDIADVRS